VIVRKSFIFLFIVGSIISNSFGQGKCQGSHAFVVNGSSAETDYCDFYADLDKVEKNLEHFPCRTTFGLGNNRKVKCNGEKGTYLSGDKKTDESSNKKNYFDKVLANLENIPADGKVVLYFSDHGDRYEKEGYDENTSILVVREKETKLSMGEDTLSEFGLQILMANIQKRRPDLSIITMNDHCYSGGMINSHFRDDKLMFSGKTCGFSSSSKDEVAYNGESVMDSLGGFKSFDKSIKQMEDTLTAIRSELAKNENKDQDLISNMELETIRKELEAAKKIRRRLGKNKNITFADAFYFTRRYVKMKSTPVSTVDTYLETYNKKQYLKKKISNPDILDPKKIVELLSNCHLDEKKEPITKISVETINTLIKPFVNVIQDDLDHFKGQLASDLKTGQGNLESKLSTLRVIYQNQLDEIANEKVQERTIMHDLFVASWPNTAEYLMLSNLNRNGLQEKRFIELDNEFVAEFSNYEQEMKRAKKYKDESYRRNLKKDVIEDKLANIKRTLQANENMKALTAMAKSGDFKAVEEMIQLMKCEREVFAEGA